MSLFGKLKGPVFLKESSEMVNQLEKLKELEPLLSLEGKSLISQEIKCLEYGIAGEKNIAFELLNSHIPMYILQDIYLEDGDITAQIDYLVFTKKLCFVIECKNLYGNIEVNNAGDFIRTSEFGGKKRKEGIYSPITQNQRHIELMKKIRIDNKKNFLAKYLVESSFEDFYKPVVVMANPKTVLNAKCAKREVKEKVIRADQLVKYIKEMNSKSKEQVNSDDRLMRWAQSYLKLHKDKQKDYSQKFEKFKVDLSIPRTQGYCFSVLEDTEIFRELRDYRLNKSREENIKPYFIYNDNQLRNLIFKNPKSTEELIRVPGFGEIKARKYGEDILRILGKY